ncbi:MAG: 16S rRNA (cytosine(1402)-N(4))-methyltransferase RsmH [Bacilli bacterium]|nr:16S rRNA (cytosine(1402)-N(4))-methyltransferase RsmH [Bacilli bacterium]
MHYSVMLNEVIESLNLKSDGIIVDATLGYGGHSSRILERIKSGHLFAFDQDIEAIEFSQKRLECLGTNFTIIKSNFLYMKEELLKRDIQKVSGIVFDLGVSSPQLDNKERGFSYLHDARLDMRMDKDGSISAYDVVNTYSESDLYRIIRDYGEEKYAKNIARNIVHAREKKNIETTFELVDIVKHSMPYKETIEKNPARRTFQAIRIEVNHELDILDASIRNALSMLEVNGRIAVITFHSLEDRIVKKIFKEVTNVDKVARSLPVVPDAYLPKFKTIIDTAPTNEELLENNRSRSARLHVIERIREDNNEKES